MNSQPSPHDSNLTPSDNKQRLGQLSESPPSPGGHAPDQANHAPLSNSKQNDTSIWRSKALLIGSAVLVGVMVAGGLLAVVQMFAQDAADVTSTAMAGTDSPVPEISTQPQPDLFSGPRDLGAFIGSTTASTVVITCSPPDSEVEELGTGFPVDLAPLTGGASASIFLVTNQHVIEGCEGSGELSITAGSKSLTGSVISFDSDLDLALVEPLMTGMPPLEMTTQASTGQWILAAGAPLGVANSASFGAITNVVKEEMLITFDAVIGPGNSGGPLVNSQGQVVGVVTAVWEEATGIGIAVPIEGLCVRLLDCSSR